MRYLFHIILLILNFNFAYTQNDTTKAIVGDNTCLSFKFNKLSNINDTITLTGLIKLSEPTLFYPEYFQLDTNFKLINQSISKIDYYSSSFTLNLKNINLIKDYNIELCGIVLAGASEFCKVILDSVKINGMDSVILLIATLKATSIGAPLPYIRFATIDNGFPNPIFTGNTIQWNYRIDAPSEINIRIFDLKGNELLYSHEGLIPIGVHTFKFSADKNISAGLYGITITTNSGNVNKIFMINK